LHARCVFADLLPTLLVASAAAFALAVLSAAAGFGGGVAGKEFPPGDLRGFMGYTALS